MVPLISGSILLEGGYGDKGILYSESKLDTLSKGEGEAVVITCDKTIIAYITRVGTICR